jgi:hypothetical protein
VDKVPPSVTLFFPNAETVSSKKQYRGPKLERIDQLSLLVDSIEDAIEFYGGNFGWGPFHLARVRNTLPYRGKPSEFEVRLAFTMVGDLEIELMEVVAGVSPHSDHLREKGVGFQHIRMTTRDVEGLLAQLAEAGIEPIFGFQVEGRWTNVYINSHEFCGTRMEIRPADEQMLEIQKLMDTSWRLQP